MTHIPKSAAGWIPDKLPNPGVQHAFERGLPVLTLDRHGRTHVARTRGEYEAVTDDHAGV